MLATRTVLSVALLSGAFSVSFAQSEFEDALPIRKGAGATGISETSALSSASEATKPAQPNFYISSAAPVRPLISRDTGTLTSQGDNNPLANPGKPRVASAPIPLPSATDEKPGLLKRMLGGSQNSASASVKTAVFNSDYATRDVSAPLPVSLRGNGLAGRDLPIGSEDTWRLNTLPTDFCPTDLVQIPPQLCYYGSGLYLRREAAESYIQMVRAAAAEGLTIQLVSGYRDFGHQMRLYTQAVARRGSSQNTVARPGKSEHQLGTTADVTNSKTHLLKRSFGETPEGRWLAANAGRFGWKMTVLRGDGPRSHADEPWHLRYLGNQVHKPNYLYTQNPQPRQRGSLLKGIGSVFGLGRRH